MNNINQITKELTLVAACAVFLTINGCGQKTSKNTSESTEFFKEIGSAEQENTESQINETMQNSVTEASSETPTTSSSVSSAPSGDKPTARDIQQALKSGNFYQGKVDGVLGPKTKKAVESFQTQNNLKVDGKVGPQTWQKLKTYYNNSSLPAESSVSAQTTETPQQNSSQGNHD